MTTVRRRRALEPGALALEAAVRAKPAATQAPVRTSVKPRTARVPVESRTASGRTWRIYHADAGALGPIEGWRAEFERIGRLGFDKLLMGGAIAGVHRVEGFAIADASRWHDDVSTSSFAATLPALVADARKAGLDLWLDLDLRFVLPQSPAEQSLGKFADLPSGSDVVDPRRSDGERRFRRLRWLDADERPQPALVDWWTSAIGDWVAAGIDGFRIVGGDRLPVAALSRLIDQVRDRAASTRFVCWTPGVAAGDVAALAALDLEAAVMSLPWWNGQDGWLVEEHARLRRFATVLSMPEAPYSERIAMRGDGSAAASRKALWTAAWLGEGWIVPMGFEYGVRDTLRPESTDRAEHWRAIVAEPRFDLSSDLMAANLAVGLAMRWHGASLRSVTSPGAPLAVLARQIVGNDASLLVAVNVSLHRRAAIDAATLLSRLPAAPGQLLPLKHSPSGAVALDPADTIALAGGHVAAYEARPLPPMIARAAARPVERAAVEQAIKQPRIALEDLQPSLDGGRFAIRRIVGERVTVTVDAWVDGHDKLAGVVCFRSVGDTAWRERPLALGVNDVWRGDFPLERMGRYEYTVQVWVDRFATWLDEVTKKQAAGRPLDLEIREGQAIVADHVAHAGSEHVEAHALLERTRDALPERRLAVLLEPATRELMAAIDPREFAVTWEPACRVESERLAARYSSWYELFPRSIEGRPGDPVRHGTFDDVIARIPAVAAMGFDVLYFPPHHPIGRANRKGRNNTLTPATEDPGSPYAIGSEAGGHDAVHPELGTLDDFRRMRDVAKAHGLELAIDFAVQCSPDHPWLKQHPEWFAFRPDGSLRYAENPPKKYEDITNVDFYSDRKGVDRKPAAPALWLALRDVVLFWADEGVKLFRVDNPHTKPLPFWEWMIAEVRARHPDAMFLAEAFTRPKMMARLGKIGFSQSYTYFTWRNEKTELIDYLTELTTRPLSEFYRPHFFVNTPDINPFFLQRSGRPGFLIRAALAATLSGLWGVYSGFELGEATPMPGKEEYYDSEKYQIRIWDWNQPGNINAEITQLNAIRRRHPALQTHLDVQFLDASNGAMMWFAKGERDADGRFLDDAVLVGITLDPYTPQQGSIELPLWQWGLGDGASLDAEDLITGHRFTWTGKQQFLRLDPHALPYAMWRVRPRLE